MWRPVTIRLSAVAVSCMHPRPVLRLLSTHASGDLSFQRFSPSAGNANPSISPIVVLHGLFGSKQNWRSLSKSMANRIGTDVIALDMRNHGESFHSPTHDYASMTDDVECFLIAQKLESVNIIGHSMGGKVAMHYALSGHSRLDKLVVVDMSPTNANLSSEFGLYITAMRKVEDAKVTSKDEANKILSETVDSLSVRQFILTNLRKLPGESTMSFRINIPALESSLDSLWTFPHEGSGKTREGPTLFIGGKKARYITASKEPLIRKFFPNATIEYLDAGHWVHSEKPEEFVSLVTSFLKS